MPGLGNDDRGVGGGFGGLESRGFSFAYWELRNSSCWRSCW